MGDSNSGVVLGSRLLDTDRAATRQSGSPPGGGTVIVVSRPLIFINAELELDEVRVVLAPADQMKTAAVDQDLGR
jgi:hypothetical protein